MSTAVVQLWAPRCHFRTSLNTCHALLGLLICLFSLTATVFLKVEPVPLSPLCCIRVDLRNTYGATEACAYQTAHRLQLGDSPRCIGTALPFYKTYLLPAVGGPEVAAQGEARPLCELVAGARGQLVLLGEALARGYLGDPHLSAAKFVRLHRLPSGRLMLLPDEGSREEEIEAVGFGRGMDEMARAVDSECGTMGKVGGVREGGGTEAADHLRGYLTGDLVVVDEQLRLHFVGRVDSQVCK